MLTEYECKVERLQGTVSPEFSKRKNRLGFALRLTRIIQEEPAAPASATARKERLRPSPTPYPEGTGSPEGRTGMRV